MADPPGRALRLPWLDLYKGLAILLVVLGHMNIPARASQLIYSFHVPLFFIASGYVMALGRQTSFRTALWGVGLLNAAALRLPLPWGGHLAPVALAFFFVGYLCSRLGLAPAILARRAAAVGLSLSFLLWIGATLANARVDMNSNQYGQPLLFFASALSGAAMVYFVVQILQSRRGVAAVATYLGANSLVILAVHTLWPSVVRSLLASLAPLAPAPLVPLLTSRIDMLLSLLLVWASIEWINRRFPSLIGRRLSA